MKNPGSCFFLIIFTHFSSLSFSLSKSNNNFPKQRVKMLEDLQRSLIDTPVIAPAHNVLKTFETMIWKQISSYFSLILEKFINFEDKSRREGQFEFLSALRQNILCFSSETLKITYKHYRSRELKLSFFSTVILKFGHQIRQQRTV